MMRINYSPAEQRLADSYIRAQMKRISEDDYVREEGRKEGREEGRKEGREEGRKEEREKADAQLQKADQQLQKAEDEKAELQKKADAYKVGIAKKLLARGMSVENVAEDTGLDYKEINKLI